MPVFRRRKVSCFYCSQQSVPGDSAAYHPSGRVSCFICPHCNADNHLDEKGEITDYVPETPPKPLQYAHRPASRANTRSPVAASSAFDSQLSPAFCRRCQNNQTIVQNAKARYPMPPEDHPDFDHHNNVLYPKYVKDMEQRWPLVCEECVPRVNQKLRRVNYDAKVASLGHMLARSEQPVTTPRPLELIGSAIWMARGVFWIWGHFLFLVWHLSAVLHPAGSNGMGEARWTNCLLFSVLKSELDAECYDVSRRQVSRHFWVPVVGFWWLYRQGSVERHPGKKLVGTKEYLKLECSTLAVRLLSWFLLGEGGRIDQKGDLFVMAHIGFFFVSLVATLFSITCLKLENTPTISLREMLPPSPVKSREGSPSPIAPPDQRSRQPQKSPQPPQSQLKRSMPPLTRRNVPIPPITPSYRESSAIMRSPSPSPQKPSDTDAMDWDPISPSPNYRMHPFVGSLPPAPNQSMYFHPSQQEGALYLSHGAKRGAPRENSQDVEESARQYPPLAQAKFLPPAAHDETGLEGLLNGRLKLVDEPEEITVASASMEGEREALYEVLTRFALLAAAGTSSSLATIDLHLVALAAVTITAAWRILRTKGSTRLLSGSEALASLGIGIASHLGFVQARNVSVTLTAAMAIQEVWALLIRMQKHRKRVFWAAERKKGLKHEIAKHQQGTLEKQLSASPPLNSFGFRTASPPNAGANASKASHRIGGTFSDGDGGGLMSMGNMTGSF